MNESLVNGKRAIVAHDESAEVAEPSKGALHGPPSFIAAQGSAILSGGLAPVLAMRGDQRPNLFPLGAGQQPTVSRHRPSLWRQLLSRASPRENNCLNSTLLYRGLKWLLRMRRANMSHMQQKAGQRRQGALLLERGGESPGAPEVGKIVACVKTYPDNPHGIRTMCTQYTSVIASRW